MREQAPHAGGTQPLQKPGARKSLHAGRRLAPVQSPRGGAVENRRVRGGRRRRLGRLAAQAAEAARPSGSSSDENDDAAADAAAGRERAWLALAAVWALLALGALLWPWLTGDAFTMDALYGPAATRRRRCSAPPPPPPPSSLLPTHRPLQQGRRQGRLEFARRQQESAASMPLRPVILRGRWVDAGTQGIILGAKGCLGPTQEVV